MCVTLAMMAGATLIAGVTSFVTSSVNSYTENQQLSMDIEVEKAQAAEMMGDRLQQYRRMAASNRVTIGSSGVGVNQSFEQGIEPTNQRTAFEDVSRIKFNQDMGVARKKYGISVNNTRPYLDAFSAMGSTASSFAGSYATAGMSGGTGPMKVAATNPDFRRLY